MLGGCLSWSESSLGAHAILLVLLCGGSFTFIITPARTWYNNVESNHKLPDHPSMWSSFRLSIHWTMKFGRDCCSLSLEHPEYQWMGSKSCTEVTDLSCLPLKDGEIHDSYPGLTHGRIYHNDPKFSDRHVWATSVDLYHTAPEGAVWSGCSLFAQTCLDLLDALLCGKTTLLQQLFGCPNF